METKKCSTCGCTLLISEFHRRGGNEIGYKSSCKRCNNLKSIDWYNKNKETYNSNKKIYRSKNREKINNTYKSYYNRRMENDGIFRVTRNTRSLIRSTFKRTINGNFNKSKKTEDILGCSMNEFILYISSLFKNGMNLENHGMWHIDHIIPISKAKCEDDVIRLNHYTNLQPLWANENIIKKNNYNYD